ncbi:hypothetical protein CDAR_540811 [Caerostris darwini]|uniref:Uncharacterized protein n=1 Tax=Caerostris darwini TaxID=1538125 RepID=A0AAV4NF84_9ARAC|nr:hypothetical protein CDAR_540811 [Caerostris darwini]
MTTAARRSKLLNSAPVPSFSFAFYPTSSSSKSNVLSTPRTNTPDDPNSSTRHQQPRLHLHSTPPLQVRKVVCSRLPEPTRQRGSDFSEISKRRHRLH